MACFAVCGANKHKKSKPNNIVHISSPLPMSQHYGQSKSKQSISKDTYLGSHLDEIISPILDISNSPHTPKTPTIDPDSPQVEIIKYSPSKHGTYTTNSPHTSMLVEISDTHYDEAAPHDFDILQRAIHNTNTLHLPIPITPPSFNKVCSEISTISTFDRTPTPYISVIPDVIPDTKPMITYNPVIVYDKEEKSKYKPPPQHRFNRIDDANDQIKRYDYNIYSTHSRTNSSLELSQSEVEEDIFSDKQANYGYPIAIVEDEEKLMNITYFKQFQCHNRDKTTLSRKSEGMREHQYNDGYTKCKKKIHRYHSADTNRCNKQRTKHKKKRQIYDEKGRSKNSKYNRKKYPILYGADSNGFFTEQYKDRYSNNNNNMKKRRKSRKSRKQRRDKQKVSDMRHKESDYNYERDCCQKYGKDRGKRYKDRHSSHKGSVSQPVSAKNKRSKMLPHRSNIVSLNIVSPYTQYKSDSMDTQFDAFEKPELNLTSVLYSYDPSSTKL